MKIILGLNANHADSSACIFIDGKLIFAVEEERINRVKHWAGLPLKSVNECLKFTQLKPKDITDIAINTSPLSNIDSKLIYFFKNYLFGKKKYEIAKRLTKKIELKKNLNKFFYPNTFSKKVNIHYIDHHISHIASSFYPSGFKNAVGLSVDGFGDFCSISIAKCEDNDINVVKKYLFPHSLGVFYEAFTQFIGFKNYGDEYKMMGLSAYGKPKYFEKILNNVFIENKNLELNLKYFNHTSKNYTYKFEGKPQQENLYNNKLEELIGINKLNINNITDIHKDIAASAQKIFETKIFEICKEIKNLNFSENLVYAGGCALNSLANKKLHDSNLFRNIFIPYAPGDGGGCIGAALYSIKKKDNNTKIYNLISPYLGPSYEDDEIKKIIDNYPNLKKFKIELFHNKNELFIKIAKYIYENKIIGNFRGRMEFGARALGNRSILANPCNPNIKNIINKKIKRRESFRPFAPAVLIEKKSLWFENNKTNPYMSSVENVKNEKYNDIPSVIHVDGTGRVQTVTKDLNEDFYLLIEKFYEISSVPILLNTSFNENEPIVMKPQDAISCFLRTEMDALVLNNFIISR